MKSPFPFLTFFLATRLFSLAFIKTTFVWTGNLFCKYQWRHISENIVVKTNPISEMCLLPDISLQFIFWVFPVSLKYTLTWEIAYCLGSKKWKKKKRPSLPLRNCSRVLTNKTHFPLKNYTYNGFKHVNSIAHLLLKIYLDWVYYLLCITYSMMLFA